MLRVHLPGTERGARILHHAECGAHRCAADGSGWHYVVEPDAAEAQQHDSVVECQRTQVPACGRTAIKTDCTRGSHALCTQHVPQWHCYSRCFLFGIDECVGEKHRIVVNIGAT